MAAPRSSCLPPSSRAAPRFVRWCRDPVCRSALLRGHLRYGLQMELLTDIGVFIIHRRLYIHDHSHACLPCCFGTVVFQGRAAPYLTLSLSYLNSITSSGRQIVFIYQILLKCDSFCLCKISYRTYCIDLQAK